MPPESRGPAAHVSIVMLLMAAAFMLARTGRDALYFQADGIDALPIAYMGMALLALPMAAMLLALVRAIGVRRTRLAATGTMVLVLAGVGFVGEPGGGAWMTLFFTVVPVVFGGLFSLAWLLASELTGGASPGMARLFSRVGAASILGGLLGAAVARGLAAFVEPRGLLLVSAVTLATAILAMARTHERFPPVDAPVARAPMLAPSAVTAALWQPYVRLLLGIAALAAVCGLLIEFHFYRVASAYAAREGTGTALFANVYIGLNLAALVVQVLVAPRLQAAIGLTRSLSVLPAVIVGLVPAVLGVAPGVMPVVLRLTEGGLKSSFHRSSWEQVYLPIGSGCRTEARLLVDGVGTRLAEGVSAAVLYLALLQAPPSQGWWPGAGGLMYALLLAGVLWLVLTRRARPYLERGTPDGTPDDPAVAFARMPDS